MLWTTTVSPWRTKATKFLQRWALDVLAGRLVGERPVQNNIVELPFGILKLRPECSHALTAQMPSPDGCVRVKSMTINTSCQ